MTGCADSIFNLNWCRNLCHTENDDGTLSGRNRALTPEESVSLTTYFYQELYDRKKINPWKLAISSYDRPMTFAELDAFSTAIANQIKDKIGDDIVVKNPDNELVVAVCSPPSEKLIAVIFAIIKIGGAYLPLDTSYPEDMVVSILRKFVPVLMIGDENSPLFTKFNASRLESICALVGIDELWNTMSLSSGSSLLNTAKTAKVIKGTFVEPIVLDTAITPENRPAVIFPTTGITTLNPRGVRISHKSIMNQLICNWKFLPYDKNGACCISDPISTIWSVSQIFSPLLKGIPLYILGKRETKDMNTLVRRIGDKKITRLYFQPVVMKDFLNECWGIGLSQVHKLLQSLSHIICIGDVMPLSLAHLFFSVFPSGKTLTNNYGWTELAGDVLSETFKSEKEVEVKSWQNRVTFGKCMDNTRVGILGSTFEPLPEWSQGEICVGGYPVALGFVNKGSYDFENAFIDNTLPPTKELSESSQITLFRTGLYGRMVHCQDDRVRLYIEGRGDDLIRHQGYEFSLGDIRTAIQSLPCVKTMEEVVLHPGKMDQSLVAFIVIKEKKDKQNLEGSEYDLTVDEDEDYDNVNSAEIVFQLKEKLPEFMIPEIIILKAMPYLKGGARIDVYRLIYLYELGLEPTEDVWVNLKLPTEEALQAARVLFLGMHKFCSASIHICVANMNSSIFDLGVTSLNIVVLTSYINAKGYEIHLREMLVSMTIRELIDEMLDRQAKVKKYQGRKSSSSQAVLGFDIKEEYSVKILDQIHSKESFQVIANAYTEKGDLEAYNMVKPSEYMDFLTYYFNAFKEQSIFIYATQKPYEEIVAVCIGQDYYTDFNINMTASFHYVLDIHQEIKGINLTKFPHKKGKILELFMLGTHAKMTGPENVHLVLLMLGELTNIAERDGYTHIYINSTNQLIRDLCSKVLGYVVVDDYPIKNFLQKDGYRPYRLAPRSMCMSSLCCRIVQDDNRRRLSPTVQHYHPQRSSTHAEGDKKRSSTNSEGDKKRSR